MQGGGKAGHDPDARRGTVADLFAMAGGNPHARIYRGEKVELTEAVN